MSDKFGPMGRLADLIGYQAAVALVTVFGGTRAYIRTRKLSRPDPVREAIGEDAYNRLIGAGYRGEIEVPRCQAWIIARRDEAIVIRHQAGEPLADIAAAYKLTLRHVRNIIREATCSQK